MGHLAVISGFSLSGLVQTDNAIQPGAQGESGDVRAIKYMSFKVRYQHATAHLRANRCGNNLPTK